ncbi:CDP-diacylglycerol diphosphatase [Prodigiosinella aquatilis]|nr:CDP-diacylglycerol diphosphatase [Prodigiosinella sp. LS101]WJV55259.1 CDP-diacylglycerol diphosphatase [Prodigiosinella sp. LS101]WJV59620.1 CDP-diacylglycerol diphosphatase [Pectobacteriaceae bacterium C111]
MKYKKLFWAIAIMIFSLLFVLWFILGRGNSNALWEIVSQKCVPNQQSNGNPAPCLNVDLKDGYALLKDLRGPYHDLLIPSTKITGIESPVLLQNNTPSFFAAAWNYRGYIVKEIGKPVKNEYLSLSINSQYGRSQNQLHIHISCLRPEVYYTLHEQSTAISTHWQPLGVELQGHKYLAIKLTTTDLTQSDPFKTLYRYVHRQDDSMGNYGLAVVFTPSGDPILLANRLDILDANRGSAEEIQDITCALVKENN